MQLSLIFTFAFQSLEGNDSCWMKIRALYHYNEPSFYPDALYPYENEAGWWCGMCVWGCVCHRNIITMCQKSLQTFGALHETRGSLNKSSEVKWVLD